MIRFLIAVLGSLLVCGSAAAQASAPRTQPSPSPKSDAAGAGPVDATDADKAMDPRISLSCDAFDSKKERTAIKSDAFGFGNPTSPDGDETTSRRSRIVLVEVSGNTGRIHLPAEFTATSGPAHPDGWWPLSAIRLTAGDLYFKFMARAPGPQNVKINRMSGLAELQGYGQQTLRATCHVVTVKKQF